MSELAHKLIEHNRRTKATFLDLGNCGLLEIPSEVGQLEWLESLSLASEWYEWSGDGWIHRTSQNRGSINSLTNLRALKSLPNLRTLMVERISDVAAISDLINLKCLLVRASYLSNLKPLARLANLEVLNLAGAQVTDLAPLARISTLQVLHISGTLVTDLGPLSNLPALHTLYVAQTRVRELFPLTRLSSLQNLRIWGTLVDNLSPLEGLSSLRELNAHGTVVSNLDSLRSVSGLETLDLDRTLISDLAPLRRLNKLQWLSISSTQITDLAPLSGLPALNTLHVGNTEVSELEPLSGISSLQSLDVIRTKVRDLSPLMEHIRRGIPVKAGSGPWEGRGIYVNGCPLTNPPPEIAMQGNEAILHYFREREAGVDHLYEAKMLILGEGGAGKTSLVRRLYEPEKSLPKEDETTKGISIHRHEFKLKNGRTFRLNIWDFGGQQIYHTTHQFFITHRSLYVLVDDTKKDYKAVTDDGFKYWLELIDVFSGHSPTLIFQNEKGGRSKQIDLAGIRARFDNVKEVYNGNLEQGDAADDAREGVEFYASHLSHIGEEVPARWLKVREDIETLAEKKPYVPVEGYFDIYRKHIDSNEAKALLLSQYLHDLGVFLHFQDDPLLVKTVILQNQWATEAVFCVLDDEEVKKKLGRFDLDDCRRLWEGSNYARMHSELLALMQKFELCYELAYSEPKTWLAPQLLSAGRPASLAGTGKADDLVLRYRYEFLPKGMISRLTVRQHRFVRNPEKAWISGVLFEQDSSSVLAEILATGEIELRGRGPERKALLSVIAADLDALNESFQGLRGKVDKRIPCNCGRCGKNGEPEFFEQKMLLYRREHERLKVECPKSFEEVDVQELLDGIKALDVEKQPEWAKAAAPVRSLQKMRIFLASSAELREERDEFDRYLREQNDLLINEGVYLMVVRWENFLDAMSERRLQDEYNEAIRQCDVFVSLFFTKTGKFTEEEFDAAHEQFNKTRRPLIYTYFKKANVDIDSLPQEDFNSLRDFQKKLKDRGHFYTRYGNIEELKLQFRGQIDKIREKLQG